MTAPAIVVERLTPSRRDDYLRFFDHEHGSAFSDNPEWAKCYCHYYEVPVAIEWSSLDAAANRKAITARIDVGEMDGFLAYAAGRVVGWLNAQPYHKLPYACARFGVVPPELGVPPHEAAAVVCFVIAPEWRRRGVARTLLAAAIESFTARGLKLIDAFPWKADESTAATDHYHGPESLFRAAGFAHLRDEKDVTIMRKLLR